MPKTTEMVSSKFLKRGDCNPDILVTIRGVSQENVGKDDDPEIKWVMHFKETEKPLVLNKTNITLCEHILKSQDTDDWIGKQIVLWDDPTVMYAGEMKGGIRVRAPKDSANSLPF